MFGAIKDLFANAVSTESFPETLKVNVPILSSDELNLAVILLNAGQSHLFEKWEPPGTNDDAKHVFFKQVAELNASYGSSGLSGYIENAKTLLKSAAEGENPLAGWKPEVPQGVALEPVTPEYDKYEVRGLLEVGWCGFVLVAGGLGERLGYNGIKVELPTQTITNVLYLEFYCKQILTMQGKYANPGHLIPLAIMVSDDTASKTLAMLENNHYFGLQKSQVTLMKQGKVPALTNNNAEIAAVGPYEIDAKPHGHGDVHSLMYSTGTAAAWRSSGVKWVVFFQDTNSLAFITLPAMLGVSVDLGLEVNSLAIPRVAKQAVGAITKLVHDDGRIMTVNVEYNQLDPLLRATGSAGGDINDPKTGRSPYPGNINQLIFSMENYATTLNRTLGAMPEFVNPKYADAAKMAFKKPTRLECMMQDYPKLLGPEAKVGFTSAPEWCCFSPCKNNSIDAAASAASGVPAGSAYTAESDQYFAYAELLRRMGATVPAAPKRAFLGISACPGPCIVLSPESAIFPSDLQCVFPYPTKVNITSRSTLILHGEVVVTSLQLDGALKLSAESGAMLLMKGKALIKNAGYELKQLSPAEMEKASDVVKMRGYQYVPQEVKEFIAIPSKSGTTKSPSKSTTEHDKESKGGEVSTSTSSYLSLPSFFSSSETKTDSAMDPAKVDEQDGVISHLDEYSAVVAKDEVVDRDSLTARMRPVMSLGSSALALGVSAFNLPAAAISAVVPGPRRVDDPQEFVCDGEQLVPIDEFVPEEEVEEEVNPRPNGGMGFFPPTLRSQSSLPSVPEYVPPSATPSKKPTTTNSTTPTATATDAVGGQTGGDATITSAPTDDTNSSSMFPSFSALMPSIELPTMMIPSLSTNTPEQPSSSSAGDDVLSVEKDKTTLDFSSSSRDIGPDSTTLANNHAISSKDDACCVPAPPCFGPLPTGTHLTHPPAASVLDSPTTNERKTVSTTLESTPTKELDKSVSLLQAMGFSKPVTK